MGADYTLVFDDFNQPPAFEFGKRTGFGNQYGIADLRLAFLIMGIKAFHLFNDLAKFRVRHASGGFDNRSLLHLSRNDLPNALLAKSARRSGDAGSGGIFAHGLLGSGCFGPGFLIQDGFEAGHLATDHTDLARLFELAALLLDAQMEALLAQLVFAGGEFLVAEVANFFDLHKLGGAMAGKKLGPNR